MDLNFEAPLTAYEFAYHILINYANIAIISMAWIGQDLNIGRKPEEPDLDTLSHWVARLEPLIRAEDEGEIIIVIANRYGTEEEATYAGTSCVLGIRGGEVKVYGILGHEEQKLLVVNTS
jgi:protein N-terminal amidase